MTLRTNARLAGFMFLFYIVTGVAGMTLFASATAGDSTAAKLASMAQHATLVRVESVYTLFMMLNPFILGVALYALTRDYDRDLALIALICRIIEGALAAVAALTNRALLTAAIAATSGSGAEAAFATAFASLLLKTRGFTTLFAAGSFAIGSTIFAYLFLRARTIPMAIAVLGVVSSALLVIGLALQMSGLIAGPFTYAMWAPVAIFEVAIAIWFLTKGVAAVPAEVMA